MTNLLSTYLKQKQIYYLQDSGAFLEKRFAGLATVEIHCGDMENSYNFTNNYTWGYEVTKIKNLDPLLIWSDLNFSDFLKLYHSWGQSQCKASEANALTRFKNPQI